MFDVRWAADEHVDDEQRTDAVLAGIVGRRLMYRDSSAVVYNRDLFRRSLTPVQPFHHPLYRDPLPSDA